MECIKIINDEDFGLKAVNFNNPRIRNAARGLIFNSEGKIAILNKKLKNEFKLIGGGMEYNETPEEAFIRESFEETGCEIKIDKCIGYTLELKSLDNFQQKSYVFVANVEKYGKFQHLTEKEKEEQAELIWLSLDDALEKIKNSENNIIGSKYENEYHTKFIVRRDYAILKYYLENIR